MPFTHSMQPELSSGAFQKEAKIVGRYVRLCLADIRATYPGMAVLGIPVDALEAISSVALTGMSTVVAGVALVFSYRQNVGWEPVLLVSASGLSGIGGQRRYKIILTLEFWNRRKYPVALRELIATVEGVTLLNQSARSESGPVVHSNRFFQHLTAVVAPHQHSEFTVEVEFEDQWLDTMRPLFKIEVGYFDAHRNKQRKAALEHKFFYPELGWKKSADERAKIEQLNTGLYQPG
jgi:hypothetical protein